MRPVAVPSCATVSACAAPGTARAVGASVNLVSAADGPAVPAAAAAGAPAAARAEALRDGLPLYRRTVSRSRDDVGRDGDGDVRAADVAGGNPNAMSSTVRLPARDPPGEIAPGPIRHDWERARAASGRGELQLVVELRRLEPTRPDGRGCWKGEEGEAGPGAKGLGASEGSLTTAERERGGDKVDGEEGEWLPPKTKRG